MSPCILVVDDEPAVTDLISYNLRKAHYRVLTAADGNTALRLAREEKPDLILLDLMLPGVDGLDVCRRLRQDSQVPVIIITARGEETDRVVGLELGADDYVCKPFSMRELLARVKAVLRRQQAASGEASPAPVLEGPDGLRLDTGARTAAVEERELPLTTLEFELLRYLMRRPGRALSREILLEEVWGYDFAGDARAVDSAVKRLRAKFRAFQLDPETIETVRGVGYRWRK
jgi:DNA-binding response OmpR family regulator